MGTATIVESNEDDLIFERAVIARNENGELVPRCFYSGIACELGTHEGALADGIVGCAPLDPGLYADWPLSVRIQKEDAPGPELVENFTANPRAVAAVRKFLTLFETGEAEVGTPL